MNRFIKHLTYFSIIYIIVFVIDTYVKVNIAAFPYRYITKTLLILSLLCFYVLYNKGFNKSKNRLVSVALLCFVIGDLFLIGSNSSTTIRFVIGVVLFAIAKILYVIRFSNKHDFEVFKLWPFLVLAFTFTCGLMLMVHKNLGNYFIPTLLYSFIAFMLFLFAFLRKKAVNVKSFRLVILGVLLSFLSDSITILKEFYDPNVLYNHYSLMFFYGMSQYFIVVGLLFERSPDTLNLNKNLV